MNRRLCAWIAPGAVAVGYAAFIAIWFLAPRTLYQDVAQALVPHAEQFPFRDTLVVLAWLECHAAGIDIYATNPCDPNNFTLAQSPLWLVLSTTGLDRSWTTAIGLAVCVSFIAALFLLPRARNWKEAAILLPAFCSPAMIFALERANTDLIVFTLLVLALRLAARAEGAARAMGYALALLAGLLKFYPLTTLALIARERPTRCLAAAAILGLALGMFGFAYATDLPRLTVISGHWFEAFFGATSLPHGLEHLAPNWRATRIAVVTAHVLLALAAFGWMLRRSDLAREIARLPEMEQCLLFAGSIVMLASFLLVINAGYRAIFLLFVVTAWPRMMRPAAGMAYWLPLGLAIALPWTLRLPNTHYDAAITSNPWLQLSWLLTQTAWWAIAGMLAAIVLAIAWHFPIIASARTRFTGGNPA